MKAGNTLIPEECSEGGIQFATHAEDHAYDLGFPVKYIRAIEEASGIEAPFARRKALTVIQKKVAKETTSTPSGFHRLCGALIDLALSQEDPRVYGWRTLLAQNVAHDNVQVCESNIPNPNSRIPRFSILSSRVNKVIFIPQRGSILPIDNAYGTAYAMLAMARELQSHGIAVGLVGVSPQAFGISNGIPFVGFPSEEHLIKSIHKIHPEVTVIGISRGDFLTQLRHRRFLVYHHGPHPIEGVEASTINRLRPAVVCVSKYSARQQMGYGIDRNLIKVIPNSYSSSVFCLQQPGAMTRTARRIIFAGHIVAYKGIDIAVDAIHRLQRRYPDVSLAIFGENCRWPVSDEHVWPSECFDEHRKICWKRVMQRVPGVQYFGHASRSRLAEEMRRSDLLVMPSRVSETFGIALLEAQACGCLPVVPDRGGFKEVVCPRVNGYLYDDSCPNALSETIDAIWSRGGPSCGEREIVAEWARQQFSWTRSAAQMASVLGQQRQTSAWRIGADRIRRWASRRINRDIRWLT